LVGTAENNYLSRRLLRPALRCLYPRDVLDSVGTEVKSEMEKEMGSFRYISYSHLSFIRRVLPHMKNGASSFIDVGCGVGDKMVLTKFARAAGRNSIDVYGIELNPHTYNLALYFLGACSDEIPPENIMRSNATCINYSKYDLIYLYRPSSKREIMTSIYARILTTMHVGAIMVEVYPFYKKRPEEVELYAATIPGYGEFNTQPGNRILVIKRTADGYVSV